MYREVNVATESTTEIVVIRLKQEVSEPAAQASGALGRLEAQIAREEGALGRLEASLSHAAAKLQAMSEGSADHKAVAAFERQRDAVGQLQSKLDDATSEKMNAVTIYGNEGVSVQLSPCCQPIPGDHIIGHLKRDQGLIVHTDDCDSAKRQRSKEPDRWIDVAWGKDLNRRFDCRIKILVKNERGILARLAAEIGESDANITYVGMDENVDAVMTELRFTVQVEDRIHLARLMRNVRGIPGVTRLLRDRS